MTDFDQVDPEERELADASAAFDGEAVLVDPSESQIAFAEDAHRLRQALKGSPVDPILDSSQAVDLALLARGQVDTGARPTRRRAALALVAAFTIGVGTAAVFFLDRSLETTEVAAAGLVDRLHDAQRGVQELDGVVAIREFGTHPDRPVRTYEGVLRYRAPESLLLSIRETSIRPSGWPANDVDLWVDREVAWRSRSLGCPVDSMPSCLRAPTREGVENRPPFSAGWSTPLDLVVPAGLVEDLALDGEADASEIIVRTQVARAGQLLAPTTASGAFRQFHPDDAVEIRLDAQRLTLRGFTIRAAGSTARSLWATTWGYDDPVDGIVFSFTIDPAPAPHVSPPEDRPSGLVDGEFIDSATSVADLGDALPSGFVLHRSGIDSSTVPGTELAAWVDGSAWVTVRRRPSESVEVDPEMEATTVDARTVYLDRDRGEILVVTGAARVWIAGSLPLGDLAVVALGLPIEGVVGESGSP